MSLIVSEQRCVALHSWGGGRYLQCVHDKDHGGSVAVLDGSDGGIMNPRCRFYLEPSEKYKGRFVHIRSCYNNKYLVPHERKRLVRRMPSQAVVGTADMPEEDLSKQSCTLHEHKYIGANGISLSHFHKRNYASLSHPFTLIDVSDRKQLPSVVAFKGDNGKFLAVRHIEGYQYLQFAGDDIEDTSAMHQVFTNFDGIVRIKSTISDKYWRRSPNWIWADSDDETHNNHDTLFKVTTGDDFVALQNLGNNKFCKRLTTEGKVNCLNAASDYPDSFARMQCLEPVRSRHIYDVEFRLNEARKYTTAIDGLTSQTVINDISTSTKSTLTFAYTKTESSTWSTTLSLKLGVKTTIETKVPHIVDGKFETSVEFNGSYTWGKAETTTTQTTTQYTVDVPPMSKATVYAVGSNGHCDIPFSYKQRDVLLNGQEVEKKFTDGMYFGVKTSNVEFNVKGDPLDSLKEEEEEAM